MLGEVCANTQRYRLLALACPRRLTRCVYMFCCQADESAVATVSKTQELKKRS